MIKNLTIIIPTYNRPELLWKSLTYMLHWGKGYKIHILDGSSEEVKSINKKNVESLNYEELSYFSYPTSLHLGMRLKEALNHVKTDYVLMWPDDDFLNSSTLADCCHFLQENPDFSAVLGRVLCLVSIPRVQKLFPSKAYTVIDHLKHSPTIIENSALKRNLIYQVITRLAGMPLFYSVRRTSQLKRAISYLNSEVTYTSTELLLNLQVLIDGKIKSLDQFYALRNYTNEATNDQIREGVNYYGDASLKYIKNVFIERMMEAEHLTSEVASYAFEQLISIPYQSKEATYGHGTSIEQAIPHERVKRKLQVLLNFFYPKAIGKIYSFDSKYLDLARALRV